MQEGDKIFFIGIGGVGMSALAVILKARGFGAYGSDRAESDMTRQLKQKGIDVRIGHNADNIDPDTKIVVYTNAVTEDNPELIRAREMGVAVMERATMLDIVGRTKFSIGISGTHGKTTTTSMVSRIFLKAGYDPTLAVGGFLNEIGGSGYEGAGKYMVYEACEAFGSVLKLHPNIAVITNIDNDHLDYYGSLANIKKAFRQYITDNIPPYGILVYNKDDSNLRSVVQEADPVNAVSVGIRYKDADFVAEKIKLDAFSSEFTVRQREEEIGRFRVNVPGIHNVYNALLAVVTGRLNGIPNEIINQSLASFENANRRFQLKHRTDHLTVIDDYAHHPSEIRATLLAARKLSDKLGAKLIAVFQPHLYSRTEAFYKDFAKSLSRADMVVLTEIYAAREKNTNNISTKIIYDEIVKILGSDKVIYSRSLDEVPESLQPYLSSDAIVVTLGAGDVWKVSEMFHSSAN